MAMMTPNQKMEAVSNLYLAGHGRLEIARRLSLPVADVDATLDAWNDAEEARLSGSSSEARRAQELARLDRLQVVADSVAHWTPDAARGSRPPSHKERLQAIQSSLRVQDQRAKLLGLYKAPELSLKISGTLTHKVEVSALAELLAQLPDAEFAALDKVHRSLRAIQEREAGGDAG